MFLEESKIVTIAKMIIAILSNVVLLILTKK